MVTLGKSLSGPALSSDESQKVLVYSGDSSRHGYATSACLTVHNVAPFPRGESLTRLVHFMVCFPL